MKTNCYIAGNQAAKNVEITLYGEKYIIDVERNQSILDAAIAAGLQPPFNCREGACGACRALLLAGETTMDNDNALSGTEIESGIVLTCQAKPVSSNIKIKYDV